MARLFEGRVPWTLMTPRLVPKSASMVPPPPHALLY
jgi:hypothetical protein